MFYKIMIPIGLFYFLKNKKIKNYEGQIKDNKKHGKGILYYNKSK